MKTISLYAATMHENPTRGNGLPFNEATLYNRARQRELDALRAPLDPPERLRMDYAAIAEKNRQKAAEKRSVMLLVLKAIYRPGLTPMQMAIKSGYSYDFCYRWQKEWKK